MADLGTLGGNSPGANNSYALGNHSLGQVVGTTTTPGAPNVLHAFIYRQGVMLDLNTLVDSSGANWNLGSASAINDNGWIVGDGGKPSGGAAFLLIPVLPGDFDRDGRVDAADIQATMTALGNLKSYQLFWSLSDDELKSIGDLDGNGTVNNADLQSLVSLLANGGGSAAGPPSTVPEPSGMALAEMGTFAAIGLIYQVARRTTAAV